jgi:uncharacterized protein (UPF0147 family)
VSKKKSSKPAKTPKASRKPGTGESRKKKSGGAASKQAKASTRAAYAIALNPKKDARQRQAALTVDPTALCESSETFNSVLNVLRDPSEPIEVRLSAFEAVAAARFSARNFESCRADYIAALREVAEDANPELRRRALGALAREKDGFAQKKLLAGLKDPTKALVPPEKALQLLGNDVHADVYAIARELAAKPPSSLVQQEALRLLASDANSVQLLENILRDKNQPVEARQISAAALHAINPPKYQQQARELLLDKDENPDIQSMSLTALTYFGDEKVADDKPLLERVDELNKDAPSPVKAMAKQFLSKYQ